MTYPLAKLLYSVDSTKSYAAKVIYFWHPMTLKFDMWLVIQRGIFRGKWCEIISILTYFHICKAFTFVLYKRLFCISLYTVHPILSTIQILLCGKLVLKLNKDQSQFTIHNFHPIIKLLNHVRNSFYMKYLPLLLYEFELQLQKFPRSIYFKDWFRLGLFNRKIRF